MYLTKGLNLQVSANSSWNKSIEICVLRGEQVVQISEHPITIDESTANVTYVMDKLSREAFNGSKVKLLNAKNISIADVEGTRGKENFTY